MRTLSSQTSLFVIPVIAILGVLALIPVPSAAASTSTTGEVSGCGSNNDYGCTYWWDWSVNGNMIPGQTVYFAFNLYNSDPSGNSIRINSFTVQTPWANYTDPSLPQVIGTGYSYYNGIAITIPIDQAPGVVQWSLQFTGEFSGGGFWCSGLRGNVCSDSANLTVIADPNVLQAQVTSLEAQISNLTSRVSSLQSQVASLGTKVTTLSTQLSQANSNLSSSKQVIATDQANLTQAQNDLAAAKSNLDVAQSQLSAANAQLATKQADLASEQASLDTSQTNLNTATEVYIPLAAAIPAAVAFIFAVLYVRKKPAANLHN